MVAPNTSANGNITSVINIGVNAVPEFALNFVMSYVSGCVSECDAEDITSAFSNIINNENPDHSHSIGIYGNPRNVHTCNSDTSDGMNNSSREPGTCDINDSATGMHSVIVNTHENLKPFWDTYRIKVSPSDGHCLLHSIISTLHSEYPQYKSYVIKDLLSDIVHEVISNMNIYLIVFDDMSIDILLN